MGNKMKETIQEVEELGDKEIRMTLMEEERFRRMEFKKLLLC